MILTPPPMGSTDTYSYELFRAMKMAWEKLALASRTRMGYQRVPESDCAEHWVAHHGQWLGNVWQEETGSPLHGWRGQLAPPAREESMSVTTYLTARAAAAALMAAAEQSDATQRVTPPYISGK